MKKWQHNTAGMILAEALIAVAMLVVAVFLVSTVVDGGSKVIGRMQREVLAQNYVEEAMEVVRNIRDSNALIRPVAIDDGDEANCWKVLSPRDLTVGGRTCLVSNVLEEGAGYVIARNDAFFLLNQSDEKEDLAGGYQRLIRVLNLAEDDSSADLEVVVSWQGGEVKRNFTIYNYVE